MLTGLQIRTARKLLGWAAWRLCRAAKIVPSTLGDAEDAFGPARLSREQEERLRRVLEEAAWSSPTATSRVSSSRRSPTDGLHSVSGCVSVRSANAFIEWCERERMSYREGFDRLVSKIERP